MFFFFFFQAEDGIRDKLVTGVQTCALPIYKALNLLSQGMGLFEAEVTWRSRAKAELLGDLLVYDDLLKNSIGLRLQRYMTTEQAQYVAVCHSHHKDVSLNF